MDPKNPLRLKLKLVGGPSTPEPSPPDQSISNNKMVDDEFDQMASDDDLEEEDFQEDGQREELGLEEDDNQQSQQTFPHEDGLRERHKKSKKKKKKKEKEKHKHKHHRERSEFDDDEPPTKKLHSDYGSNKISSKVPLSAFKELLEHLLQHLEKKDPQNFFAFPVTDVIAPGYSSIITTPMDFSLMAQKIKENAYSNLNEFKSDLRLICNNCMVYNQPDTIYYKAAKKLLNAGERVFSPERILQLRKDIPNVMLLSKEQLGFDINSSSILILDNDDVSRDSIKTSDNENSEDNTSKFQAMQEISAEEVLEQAQKASKEAAERLTLKKPISTLGFLRQRRDGTTTLNFLTGCEGSSANESSPKEKTINLGLLTGKLNQGTSSLNNYREDKRSMAKPVKPLYYGAFSSFCPSFDSTFANLTKEESEMVYATYGNETAVQYAESICDFSRDCDMAMHLVDQLLNLLTHEHHSRTKAVIEERRRLQQEEQKINALLYSSPTNEQTKDQKPAAIPNFSSLHTLNDLGIDTRFLNTFEQMEHQERVVGMKLEETGALIESLSKEQRDRLSKPLPANLNNLPPPSQNEVKLAEKVTEGLISVARQVPPGAIAPVPIVRRALGITMMPVTLDSAEQIEVDIEDNQECDRALRDAGAPGSSGVSSKGAVGTHHAGRATQTMPHIIQATCQDQEAMADRKLKEMLST